MGRGCCNGGEKKGKTDFTVEEGSKGRKWNTHYFGKRIRKRTWGERGSKVIEPPEREREEREREI